MRMHVCVVCVCVGVYFYVCIVRVQVMCVRAHICVCINACVCIYVRGIPTRQRVSVLTSLMLSCCTEEGHLAEPLGFESGSVERRSYMVSL